MGPGTDNHACSRSPSTTPRPDFGPSFGFPKGNAQNGNVNTYSNIPNHLLRETSRFSLLNRGFILDAGGTSAERVR